MQSRLTKFLQRRSDTKAKVNSSEHNYSVDNEAGIELVEKGSHHNIFKLMSVMSEILAQRKGLVQ